MREGEMSICATVTHFQDIYYRININQGDYNISSTVGQYWFWNCWIQVRAPFMFTQKKWKIKVIFEPFAWDLFAKFDSCAANAAPRDAPASLREPLQVIGGENGLVFQDTLIALK